MVTSADMRSRFLICELIFLIKQFIFLWFDWRSGEILNRIIWQFLIISAVELSVLMSHGSHCSRYIAVCCKLIHVQHSTFIFNSPAINPSHIQNSFCLFQTVSSLQLSMRYQSTLQQTNYTSDRTSNQTLHFALTLPPPAPLQPAYFIFLSSNVWHVFNSLFANPHKPHRSKYCGLL